MEKRWIIDLGGIHNTAKGETDLWDDLGLTPGKLTEDQKNQTHTLTILYMERGANVSNCTMNFTLPSARISEVTNVPMADLTFNKINSKGEGISGASLNLLMMQILVKYTQLLHMIRRNG